jgi:hypothetical protein
MRNDRHMTVSRSLERLTLECLSAMDEQEWARRRALAATAAAVDPLDGSGPAPQEPGRPSLRLDGDTWVCEWPLGEPVFTISRWDLARGSAPTIGVRAAPVVVTCAGARAGGSADGWAGGRGGGEFDEGVMVFPDVYPPAWMGA